MARKLLNMNRKNEAKYALIFLCDVVGYSLNSQIEQERIVEKLWDVVTKDEFFFSRTNEELHVHGTGDGLYLVCRLCDSQEAMAMYNFTQVIKDKFSLAGLPVRYALHAGSVQTIQRMIYFRKGDSKKTRGFVEREKGNVDKEEERVKHIAGHGLNEAARIVSYAAKDQLVMSEQFLHVFNTLPLEIRKHLHPPHHQNPHRSFSKHSLPVEIRFDSRDASPRIKTKILIRNRLVAGITELRDEVANFLESHTISDTHFRISIFQRIRQVDEEFLECSEFRFSSDGNEVATSPTCYHFRTENSMKPVEGLALALAEHKAKYIKDLPDYTQHPLRYFKKLKSTWNVEKKFISQWTIYARAFIVIPIMLGDGDDSPEGVVCIDFMDSLSAVEIGDFEDVIDNLFALTTRTIAPTWKLWVTS
jgi:hypothetical protein